MRYATVAIIAALAACNDLREFRGSWHGDRVGEASVLHLGVPAVTQATLTIDAIDSHGLTASLTVEGLLPTTELSSIPGAEADALSAITFSGSPIRVYLAFVPVPDHGGDAFALVALYDDKRIEVRLLRGGSSPIYAIFAMTEIAP